MLNFFSSDPTHEDTHTIKALAGSIVSNFKWTAQNISLVVIMLSFFFFSACFIIIWDPDDIWKNRNSLFFFLPRKAVFKMKLETEFSTEGHLRVKLLHKQYSRYPPFKFRRAGVIWVFCSGFMLPTSWNTLGLCSGKLCVTFEICIRAGWHCWEPNSVLKNPVWDEKIQRRRQCSNPKLLDRVCQKSGAIKYVQKAPYPWGGKNQMKIVNRWE